VEEVVIKIAVIVGALVIWMALVFNAERQSRKGRPATGTPEPTEASQDSSRVA
jgi:hypothetical protein